MKFKGKLILIALAVMLSGVAAQAAVDNSHHDLSAYVPGLTESCFYCHGIDTAVSNAGFGTIGDLCVSRCHIGTLGAFPASINTMPNRPATMAADGSLVNASATLDAIRTGDGFGHGLAPQDLLQKYGATGVYVDFDTTLGDTLPYADDGSLNTMECTSCHNVHDNTNTPFLHRSLATGGPSGASFCESCHTSRGNSWAAGEQNPNGDHPVNFAIAEGAVGVGKATARANVERIGRQINFDLAGGTVNIFDVFTPSGAALDNPATEYITGGHLGNFETAATTGTTFGCYTCHSAHMDGNGPTNNLVLRETLGATSDWNPLCVSCHGTEATGVNDPNPGDTTYFHPVGNNTPAGSSPAIIGALGAGNLATYPVSGGKFNIKVNLTDVLAVGLQGDIADAYSGMKDTTNYRLACTSCHDVHGGITGSMALLDLDGTRDGSFTGDICSACHDGSGLIDVADNDAAAGETKALEGVQANAGNHHRTRTSSWAAGTITDADGDTLNMDGVTWNASTASLGCGDCHVFSGDNHNNAHNW